MRQKSLSLQREHGFLVLKEYKRFRRMRQEYFAVLGEYADRHKIGPISTNFPPKPKKIRSYKNTFLNMTEWKKHISRFWPFNGTVALELVFYEPEPPFMHVTDCCWYLISCVTEL